jgi:ribosome-binding protein aMBF1 (putative translation factor)
MASVERSSSERDRPGGSGFKGASAGLERLRQRLQARKADDASALVEGIAQQVLERREAWGLSQRELAELCGTTQSAIARLERGIRPPRIDTLLRIANALDCELRVDLRPRTKGRKR